MSEEQVRILLIEDNPVHVRLLGELIRNGSPCYPASSLMSPPPSLRG
jgi:CheY-like chemotaxis protein